MPFAFPDRGGESPSLRIRLEILGLRPTLVGISACYLAAGLLAFLGPAPHELDKASN